MKISVLKNATVVEVGSAKHIDSSKSFSYVLNQDSVTIKKDGVEIATALLSETTVNSTQLTAGNAKAVLAALIPNMACCCCGGSSSSIIYIADIIELPAIAIIDDLAALTSDGTETGELLELYRWNGFEWVLESMKANLIVSNTGLTEWNIMPEPSYNADVKTLSANGKKYYLIKSKDGDPVLLSQKGTLEGIPQILNQDGEYYFKNLNVVLTEKENTLTNIFLNNGYSNNLNIVDSSNVSTINDKYFSFLNSPVGSVNISDSNIKDILLKDLIYTEGAGTYIQDAGYGSIVIENVFNCMGFSVTPNKSVSEDEIRNIAIKNTDFPDGYIMLNGYYEQDQKLSLKIENVIFGHTFRIDHFMINDIDFTNCNADNLIRIEFSLLKFASQAICDKFFTGLQNIVQAGANIYLQTGDFAPSQSIQDVIRAKGITFDISQY